MQMLIKVIIFYSIFTFPKFPNKSIINFITLVTKNGHCLRSNHSLLMSYCLHNYCNLACNPKYATAAIGRKTKSQTRCVCDGLRTGKLISLTMKRRNSVEQFANKLLFFNYLTFFDSWSDKINLRIWFVSYITSSKTTKTEKLIL